jgi:Leucine-rich repeat (LRR) protein
LETKQISNSKIQKSKIKMSGGGSKEQPEQELLSIETYSGNVIGQIKSDATKDEIQKFIQETTENKSHVRFMRTKDTVLFGFIDNRHDLLEWKKADEYGWSLEIDTSEWKLCAFEGTTLIQLDCHNNQLTELPDLRQCISLTYLNCSDNQLTELPDLSKCVSLKTLFCSYNQLTELPDLRPCVSLQYLYCSWNLLTELPDLSKCISLTYLYCHNNQLTELPDLSKCVSLKELHCSANQLTELPDLSKCVSLKQLHCSHNQLTELPDLRPCVSLKKLYCFRNQLTEELKVPSGTKVYK